MKHLELNLNKRLLIVESENETQARIYGYNKYGVLAIKLICKGSDLTEDIAKEFLHQSLHTGLFAHYVKDIPVNTYCHKSALEAFGYAIESNGFYWKINPMLKAEGYSYVDLRCPIKYEHK